MRSTCQACHCECGVIIYVKDGRVVKIEGDPDHPLSEGMMCPKGLAYKQLIYHPNRLKYPLKRIGAKGEGKWQRISWDEALDTIAERFKEIIKEYGPMSIAYVWDDGPRTYLNPYKHLLYAMGSPNAASTGPTCYYPSLNIRVVTFGEICWDMSDPDFRNSKCILIWGTDPTNTHPVLAKHIIEAKFDKGAKLIVVDPRFTVLASKADLWLQIRPATDAALALAMLNVIINEELYDKEFVEKWCIGFEKLRERVQQYPPEKVAEITWVPADQIREAARTYATTKPACLYNRTALEGFHNTGQTLRALNLLIAITGNFDVKGGNRYPQLPKGYMSDIEVAKDPKYRPPQEVENKRIGADEFPLLSGPISARPCVHPTLLIKAILTGKPYPIKALYGVANWVHALENTQEVVEALKKLDFMVCADFFMTPFTEFADIVLPAATWVEVDDIADRYPNFIRVRQKAIEPVGECWDEKKITIELAKRMGISDRIPFFAETVEEYLNNRLKAIGITFEDLRRKVNVIEPIRYRKYEERGFKTPSGKVELYSSILEKYGYDPLPHYVEPPESYVSSPELAKEYPFILITGVRRIVYYHSANRQIPWLRELHPEPIVEIHPETAHELGIQDGDWVWIETPGCKHRVKQKAKLTPAIHPKVVSAETHWWYPEKGTTNPENWYTYNINMIMDNKPYDPIFGTTILRGRLCKIYKATEA